MGKAPTSYSQGKHQKCPENIQRTVSLLFAHFKKALRSR